MSTWICKASAGVLTILALAACGGGGGSGGSGNITPDGPGGASKVFLADISNTKVFSAANANPPTGVITLSRAISGTGITGIMPAMAYDSPPHDRLYIVKDRSIVVIDNASVANGNVPPARTITSAAIASTITSIFLDTARDELYVTDGASGVFLFTGISAASGPIPPHHTITLQRNGQPIVPDEVFVDTTHHVLYAKSPVTGVVGVAKSITILTNAHTLDGQHVVGPELTFPSTQNITGITGDGPSDKLFVANSSSQTVMVFDGASALSGVGVPTRSIDTTPTFLEKIVQVPSTNRLYGIAADLQSVYIVNNARAASGTVPLAVLTSSNFGTLSALAVAQ